MKNPAELGAPTMHPTANPIVQPIASEKKKSLLSDPVASSPPAKEKWTVDPTLVEKIQSHKDFSRENGKVSWCCGGRFVTSPGVSFPLFITTPLIVIPSCAHFYFDKQPIYVTIVTAAFMCGVLLCLFMTTFREPGFIPRQPKPSGEEPPNNTAVVNPADGKLWKYCSTCHVWRPPRSKHCRTTDACVYMFDHYCPWMGNAIGERNYIPFYSFVTLVMVYAIMIFVQVVMGVGDINESERTYVWAGLVMFCLIVSLLTLILCCSLTCNLGRGVTTNEARLGRDENENNNGCCKNMAEMFLTNKPSQITY